MTVKENYTVKPEYENHVCCICGKTFTGYGNNPEGAVWKNEKGEIIKPTFGSNDRCCDDCNSKYVIPGRIYLMSKGE